MTNKQFTVHDGIDYSIKENSEMRKMRKELNDLKKENEFLKKAAAYFAKNQE
ncbi:hypothetical protein [Aliivibrio logei]|uniref:hypothetical protein n=1 Tax=Aliivibrio logei TaxID=688 RepID=UPI0035C90F72